MTTQSETTVSATQTAATASMSPLMPPVAWHVLRVGAALCFIGHGAFGLITKEAWVPYFGLVGIPPEVAFRLMPLVGAADILVGVLALIRPMPVVFAYMVVWALWTAMLRPLTGEPFWELLERAGNYGVPLALLLLPGIPTRVRNWFSRMHPPQTANTRGAGVVLRGTVVLLLLGHAGFGLEGRELLASHYAAVGLSAAAVPILGGFELGLAVAIAFVGAPGLLLFAMAWKVGIELLYPLSGAPIWEFIERAGSYAAPLALALLIGRSSRRSVNVPTGLASTANPQVQHAMAVAVVALGLTIPFGTARGVSPRAPLIAAADTVWNRMRGDVLLRELRVGTLVLACRHAITDRSHGDNRNVDFEDRTTQRNLSAEGERQARDLGREIEELNLPIGTVLTSPYARTRESAELTFGRAENSTLLYGQRSRNEVQALFGEAPTNGNRVLMTHQYVLRRMLRVFRNGEIAEGDCVVVHPLGGEGYEIVAHLKPEDWGSLRSSDARSRRGAGRLNHISAVYR